MQRAEQEATGFAFETLEKVGTPEGKPRRCGG